MLLPGPDLHCVGPLALEDFRGIFLPSIGGDQKKVSPSERRAPSWYYGVLW